MAFRNIPPNGFPAIPDIEDLEAVVKDVSTLKTTTAAIAEDVGDLEDQKANQITIALTFDPETTYEVGDLVYYNGLSYRCTNEHTGEWDADDFAGTTIANELSSLRRGLTGKVGAVIVRIDNVEFPSGRSGDLTVNLPVEHASRTLVSAFAYSESKAVKPYVTFVDNTAKSVQFYTENSESSALTRTLYMTFLVI